MERREEGGRQEQPDLSYQYKYEQSRASQLKLRPIGCFLKSDNYTYSLFPCTIDFP